MKRTFARFQILTLCCCLVVALAACGQRGPLFLPDKEPVAENTAVAPEDDMYTEEQVEEDDEENP